MEDEEKDVEEDVVEADEEDESVYDSDVRSVSEVEVVEEFTPNPALAFLLSEDVVEPVNSKQEALDVVCFTHVLDFLFSTLGVHCLCD